MARKIRRNYRIKSPIKALNQFKAIKHALTDNPNFPESAWGVNLTVRLEYFVLVDNYEVAFNAARNYDRVAVAARDTVKQKVFTKLDEIVPLLEAMAIHDPDALLTTGFEVTQERGSYTRTKKVLVPPVDFNVINAVERGTMFGSASKTQGAFNYEIHINEKDPAAEEDWKHHAIFPRSAKMVLDNLDPGKNYFFRMRPHGPDGPGPWSATVSAVAT